MKQHPILEKSLVEIRFGNYQVGAASALKDPAILANVRNYKRQVASRFTPLAREDIARKIPESEYLVSRKIDGEFCVLVYQEGHAITVNPGGRVRLGLPWQQEAAEAIAKMGIKSLMIAGELYLTNDANRRPRVHDVVSIVRQPASEADLERIHFAAFDLISIDEQLTESPYHESLQWLESNLANAGRIHTVETKRLKSHRDIENLFKKWVDEEGSEGLVVRSESAGSFKIKPKHNIDAVVLGFTESTDDRQGLLHDLLLGIVRHDRMIQVLCRVGGGFTDEDRRELLSDLQDMVVSSEYAEVNSDHIAYQMVEPKWVIEISCLDLISQNTRGGPVNRMILNWNGKDRNYEVVRRMPLVSVISPQFIRIREDKQFNATDVRLSQISDLVPIPMTDVDARALKMARSSMMEREVYTKQLRGEMLVRKFLMWRTNKERDSNDFPAFVTAYTDFSPSRKTPLTREVRVSNSEVQIRAMFASFKEANIKKGWELHSTSSEISELSEPKKPPASDSSGSSSSDRSKKPVSKKTESAAQRKSKTQTSKKPTSTKKSATPKPAAKKTKKSETVRSSVKKSKKKTTPKKAAIKKQPKKKATTKKTAASQPKNQPKKTAKKKTKSSESSPKSTKKKN